MTKKNRALSLIALIVFGIGILIGWVFLPVKDFSFLGIDDHIYIYNNPYVSRGLTVEGVRWAFSADLTVPSDEADYWQPLTFLSRMLDVELFGLNAGAHHLVNLGMHLVNVALILVLFYRLTRQAVMSAAIALLFALHPVNAEVMGWVTARKDVLSAFFMLVGFLLYFRLPAFRPGLRLTAVSVCMILGLLAKPVAIIFPGLIVALEIWPARTFQIKMPGREGKVFLKRTWALWLLALLYLPVPFLQQPQAITDSYNHPLIKALWAYGFYLQKMVWPADLTLYGPVALTPLAVGPVVVSALAIVSLSVAAFLSRQHRPYFLAGWLFFLIGLLPSVGLRWPADRFLYLPKLGLFMVAVAAGMAWARRSKIAFIASLVTATIILAGYASLSRYDLRFWANNEVLFERVLKLHPENYAAHNVLGIVFAQKKDLGKAEAHLREAIRLFSSRDKPWHNLGQVLEMEGKLDEAEDAYRRALTLRRDYQTLTNFANVRFRQGAVREAKEFFKEALALRPGAREIMNNLAIANWELGEYDEAFAMARQLGEEGLWRLFEQGAVRLGRDDLSAVCRKRGKN